MPKLKTPVLYEDTLGGLNLVRPLHIDEKVDNVIDLPILNSNPLSNNKVANGKFARCDNAGVLLKCDRLVTEIDDIIFNTLTASSRWAIITFPYRVNNITLYNVDDVVGIQLWWQTLDGLYDRGNQNPFTVWQISYNCAAIRIHANNSGEFSINVGCAFVYN